MTIPESAAHEDHPPVTEQLAAARSLIEAARFPEAEAVLADLCDGTLERTDRIEALYTLAVARRYDHNLAGALQATEQLIAEQPDYARAYQERGYVFIGQNRPVDATNAFARAVELNPALVASWKALARLHERVGRNDVAASARERQRFFESLPHELVAATDLMHEGRLRKAEQLCRDFLQRNRQRVEGMRLLAEIGIRLKIYDDAEFLLESCIEFEPEHNSARADYVSLLNRKSKFEKAREQAKILLDRQPDNTGVRAALATALVGLGRTDEGIAEYRRIIAQDDERPGIRLLLGHAQKAAGAFSDAIESYREAYRIRPDFGDAYWSLANTKTYRFTDAELDEVVRQEAVSDIAVADRIHFCFAAGKAFEDRGKYDTAFEYYQRGNALKQQATGYDPERAAQRVQAQIDTCTRDLFETRGRLGYACSDPIFIVGLPRAGSTLLEQILASHSMVDGTMELHNILGLAQRLRGRTAGHSSRYPEILWKLEDGYFRRFGEQFIQQTRVYRGNAPMFIDKMPNNFLHIGLIRLILPGAKVIDARRQPMACCFSGFKQLFGEGQDFTYGLESIGRYYRDYVRLMDHWDAVLPGFVLRVMHEDVVDDLEGQVRRILEFCDLPFEEDCLRFHETERSVRTPSSEQVRQPIYRSGLAQWRHFAHHLDPLRDALGPDIMKRCAVE